MWAREDVYDSIKGATEAENRHSTVLYATLDDKSPSLSSLTFFRSLYERPPGLSRVVAVVAAVLHHSDDGGGGCLAALEPAAKSLVHQPGCSLCRTQSLHYRPIGLSSRPRIRRISGAGGGLETRT